MHASTPYPWLIVDGNNLLHHERQLPHERRHTSFDRARWGLARRLVEVAGELADRVTLVFDGSIGGRDPAFDDSAVDVIFSPPESSADTVIEDLARRATSPSSVTVVTSDHAIRRAVEACGARSVSCARFADDLRAAHAALSARLARRPPRHVGPTLGDCFPDTSTERT